MGGYDAAIGSRYVPGGKDKRPAFRAWLSYIFNVYTRLFLGRHFWDWTSGFAAVRRELLLKVPLSSKGFGDYFIEWIYRFHRQKARLIEVPYHYGIRKAGISKTDGHPLQFLKLAFRYAMRVITVRIRD